MPANYIIEHHDELGGIGRRSHPEIDLLLDRLESAKWEHHIFNITSASLAYEVSPGILRIPLPSTVKPIYSAKTVLSYMDGRATPSGRGWSVVDGVHAVDVFVPVDPDLRARYLADEGVEYELYWLPA